MLEFSPQAATMQAEARTPTFFAAVVAESNSSPIDQASAANDAERIAPAEGKSAGEIHATNEAAGVAARLADEIEKRRRIESTSQFSLRDLLLLTTIVAVELAGLQWFGSRGLAAIIGLAAVTWLAIIAIYQLKSPVGRLVYWSLLIGYFLTLAIVLASSLARV
jgi:hypothetical protein